MGYVIHPSFVAPNSADTPIWRYISFTKLVSLLITHELHFARSDLLGDNFEGSYTAANVSARPTAWRAGGIPEARIPDMSKWFETVYRKLGRFTFINCWTALNHESVALWNLYSSMTQGVVLRSTFGRLTNSLGASDHVIGAGLVQYIDYDAEMIPEGSTYNPFLYKRRSYQFESELRALIQEVTAPPEATLEEAVLTAEGPSGIRVPVDLNTLLQRIHIAPAAEQWFADLVQSTVDRLAQGIEVRRSAMKRDPLY